MDSLMSELHLFGICFENLSKIHSTDAVVSLATCELSEGSLKASTLACHKSNFKFMAERAN